MLARMPLVQYVRSSLVLPHEELEMWGALTQAGVAAQRMEDILTLQHYVVKESKVWAGLGACMGCGGLACRREQSASAWLC